MRRYDIDWLRVIVFLLLIFYHVVMFFVPWEWHTLYDNLKFPMIFVSQWRLSILFIISGIGTAYAMSKRSTVQFAGERLKKLLIPLIFGILFIVPPQVYLERVACGDFTGSYIDFWSNIAFKGIYPTGNLSWHHLWFLPYLLFYSLVLIPIFILIKKNLQSKTFRTFNEIISSTYGVYWLIIPFIIYETFLKPYFPSTHDFIDDWYNMAKYSTLFIYGFLFIMADNTLWLSLLKNRLKHLLVGVVTFGALILITSHNTQIKEYEAIKYVISMLRVISMWSWIMFIFGFATKYLNRPGKTLKYATEAVYPFYILHQTVTVFLGFLIMNKQWSFLNKFFLMVVGTFGITWLLYEYILRRINFLRPLFGLKQISK